MKLPVRIFSDLHLGHKASTVHNVESLRALFTGIGTLIFNGDTWEELAEPWRVRSGAMLDELKAIAAEEGCDLIFIKGNHDPNFASVNYIELAGGRIVVTHGDALLRYSSPWKREILADQQSAENIWEEFPDAEWDVESRFRVAERIAQDLASKTYTKRKSFPARCCDAVFPPRRAALILDAWIYQGAYAADFCETYFPKAEVLIIGHFHCAALKTIRAKTIINTGSFVNPAVALSVGWDGSILRAENISKAGKGLEIGDSLGVWEFT